MLAYIFSFILGLSPALQALFDLPLQLALQRAVLAGCLAWFFLRAFGAGLPRAFIERRFFPLWAAAALTLASLLASPLRGQVFNEWGNYAAGLLIFLFASFINKEGRDRVERAVLWGAWLLFALSLLQAFVLKNFLSVVPLTNLNALALYAVMIIPLALSRGAWPLAAAMLILVVWTQSLGAALAGLAASGLYAVSRPGGRALKENALPLAALAVLAAAVFYLLQYDSLAGRLAWWRSAWEMFLARPLAGFGCASFTWVSGAFQPDGAFREYSIYAHNYYLEFLAENGLPAAIAWFWLVLAAARSKTGLARYSLVAALVHSLVDFGLSVPANFWLFCWLLSSPAAEGEPVRLSRPAARAALIAALLLCAALLSLDRRSLVFERARGRALAAAIAGDFPSAEAELAPALGRGLFRAPALDFLGRLGAADRTAPPGFASAVYFEMALLENRYNARAWAALRRLYSAPGFEARAAGLEARRREVFE
jgi:O-antigen ligase